MAAGRAGKERPEDKVQALCAGICLECAESSAHDGCFDHRFSNLLNLIFQIIRFIYYAGS